MHYGLCRTHLSQMSLIRTPHLHLPTRRPKWYRQRFIRICTQAAAVLLLVAGSWYASRTVIIEDTAKQYLSVAAPAGQRIDITLQDGTSVCLNSGAKLEYPIRFNRNRRVKLSGEAMFNVEHDAAVPSSWKLSPATWKCWARNSM